MQPVRSLVSVLVCLVFAWLSIPASAQTDDSNRVGACLDAGEVWLIVVDELDQVLSNQCVGNPSNGEEALAEGGMRISRSRNGLICTIDEHPERCPSTFTGQFWNYHHAEPGAAWKFSDEGAAQRSPRPGTIEGWCYNAVDTQRCSPPLLSVVINGETIVAAGVSVDDMLEPAVTTHEPVPLPSSSASWLILTGIGLALALLAAAGYVIARRRNTDEKVFGGR